MLWDFKRISPFHYTFNFLKFSMMDPFESVSTYIVLVLTETWKKFYRKFYIFHKIWSNPIYLLIFYQQFHYNIIYHAYITSISSA